MDPFSLYIALLLTLLLVAIEVPLKSNASMKACLTLPLTLYIVVYAIGNSLGTLLAVPLLSSIDAKFLTAYTWALSPIAGVFAFSGVLANTNITILQRNVLTIEEWISKSRDLAVASATKREAKLRERSVFECARKLATIDEAKLNAYLSQRLNKNVSQVEAAALAAKAEVAFFKALILATELNPDALAGILKQEKIGHRKLSLHLSNQGCGVVFLLALAVGVVLPFAGGWFESATSGSTSLSSRWRPGRVLTSISRGRQKRTLADLRAIATAVEAYTVDSGSYPRGEGAIDTLAPFLTPTYLRKIPDDDRWPDARWSGRPDGTGYTLWVPEGVTGNAYIAHGGQELSGVPRVDEVPRQK